MRTMSLVAGGVLVTLLAAAWLRHTHVEPLPDLGTLPEFQLDESRGIALRRADLQGETWVAAFLFTTCPSFCPRLTAQLKHIDAALPDVPVKLVAFSVDPKNDTPEVLRQYARQHGLESDRWRLVTGEPLAMYRLIRDGFRLSVEERTDEEARDGEGLIAHSDRFVLVDGAGRIRGYYHGTDAASVEQLVADVPRLVAESPEP